MWPSRVAETSAGGLGAERLFRHADLHTLAVALSGSSHPTECGFSGRFKGPGRYREPRPSQSLSRRLFGRISAQFCSM
jgi:hypothetical protein